MRGTSRRVAVSVAVALACLSAVGPALGGAGQASPGGQPSMGGQGATAQAQAPPGFQSAVDPDAVVLRATVGEDGTAAWTVEFRVRLDDENATAAFESVQDDVEANETAFTEQFATGMARTVASAENRTGREMTLENVTVDASKERLPQEYGVLTYRFTWTNFAATDGDRLRIGDSLSGFFLDRESSLVLAWPTDYERQSVSPDPDESGDSSVTWHGQASFGPNEPRVVAAAGGGLPSSALLAGIAVLVVAAAAAGWLYRVRDGVGDGGSGDGTEAGGTDASADGAADASATDEEADADGEADADAAGADEPPEELLSNEERVIRLLESNGGRIKQQQIAGEFDWTDAKTSQVVGTLRDDDAVETFRIGRENVVALPEESDL